MTALYFSSLSYNGYQDNFLNQLHSEADTAGKFFINIAKRINPCRFVSRNGEWSLPWEQKLIPKFQMPAYDPTFNKTFSEITDAAANRLKTRIQKGEKFALMYSGGIDSTLILSAMIKNLTSEELKSFTVCASVTSMIENPHMWENYIKDKIHVIDSKTVKYDDLIDMGFTPITADEGDCIFGTSLGLTLYNNFDYYVDSLLPATKNRLKPLKYKISSNDVHYSVYADLLIKHLGIPSDPTFGKLLYEKYVWNVETATVPIHSLHDFFWWLIFNVKYLNCAVRGALYHNDRTDYRTAIDRIENWYSGTEYQLWSMVNNNNGQKIKKTLASYKWAAREYIWDLDRNDYYKFFKLKTESFQFIVNKQDFTKSKILPQARMGFTTDYQVMSIDDVVTQDFFRQAILNYKIDWS